MPRAGGYPSDLTDAQWHVMAGYLPAEVPGRRGRPRVWLVRRIIEAILYLDRTGCAWRSLPDGFPPWQTVYGYFAAWRDDGTLARLHDALRARVRTAAGRDSEPTAAVIDSQSVRAADTVPRTSRGWDNAKKTSDAVDGSSSQGWACWSFCREGCVLVEAGAVGQAVVKAAEHAVEEVALGGCVLVPGFAPPVVVSPCSG
jgi:transposase